MTATLVWNDDGWKPVPDDCKGGYGLALEILATSLGCQGDLHQEMCDGPVEAHNVTLAPGESWVQPVTPGWVNVSDGEGNDAIYNNGKLMATVAVSSRACWFATAHTVRGHTLYCMGANVEMTCEGWSYDRYV